MILLPKTLGPRQRCASSGSGHHRSALGPCCSLSRTTQPPGRAPAQSAKTPKARKDVSHSHVSRALTLPSLHASTRTHTCTRHTHAHTSHRTLSHTGTHTTHLPHTGAPDTDTQTHTLTRTHTGLEKNRGKQRESGRLSIYRKRRYLLNSQIVKPKATASTRT